MYPGIIACPKPRLPKGSERAPRANGDKGALNDLTPLVYKELRRLAGSHLRRERKSHTLQPTALVHEAYLRLVDQKNPNWQNRSHFFGVASRLMRQILVDHARTRQAGNKQGSAPLGSPA